MPPERSLLGFDVAEPRSPFWLIVAEYPSKESLRPLLARLNRNGLFDSPRDAHAFLEAYRAGALPGSDLPLVLWEVHSVERAVRPGAER